MNELKAEIARVIAELLADGQRKANIEIELIHYIKRQLYGGD